MSKKLKTNEISATYNADIKHMNLTATQESAISRMSNLVIGNTYLFVPQLFHAKPNAQSPTGFSNRAACYEIDPAGNVVGVKTLSFSALRAAYLGKVKELEHIPQVESEERDGVIRAKRGAVSFVSNIAGGQAPISVKEVAGIKTAAITAHFALKVTGRSEYFTTVMNRREDGKYDMATNPDGTLQIQSRNDYDFQYVAPTAEMLKECNPAVDMAALKDYLL